MGRYALGREWAKAARGVEAFGRLAREVTGPARGSSSSGARSCPVCGWSGERFAPMYYVDHFRDDAMCYGCTCLERCRFVKTYIDRELGAYFAGARRKVLDIGPVRYSRAFFPDDVDYVSFDLYSPLAMVRGDISATPLSDAFCDLWLCSHVLDVVPDDTAAMRELFRLLRPGGVGILDNAMHWDRTTEIYEGPRARECGHRRRYGTDLPDRLRAVGFEVSVVDSSSLLPAPEREHLGIGSRKLVVCRRSP
jgi:SAM-dependent methyltransferase